MVVVLHYAELCVEMFPARLDATNIAITFGSILGSLQGGDIFGPEVGIAICALEMVSQRLAKVMQSSGPENSLATPAAKDTQSLYGDDEKTVETLAAILIYGLEMVPSTALTKLCDIIDNFILDVSHNPASVRNLISFLKKNYKDQKFDAIFAAMTDKDCFSIIKDISDHISEWNICSIEDDRFDTSSLIGLVESLTENKVNCIDTVYSAVERGYHKGTPQIVFGSFLTVSEAYQALEEIRNR